MRTRCFNEANEKRYKIRVLKTTNKFWEVGEVAEVYEHTDGEYFVFAKDYHFLIRKENVEVLGRLPDANH